MLGEHQMKQIVFEAETLRAVVALALEAANQVQKKCLVC